ncbi:MAG: hypothetical protein A2Y24_01725 [Clostridiales bacterium GWE2_32_10]|nr:MAG: hypothetical protein A2X02_04715 [Bacteroidetes bacterium GWF2_29_10]OGO87167.1 MAG: hypothetical protein A2Y24_01725 [Clostridiales bacterium GWE2_32_10]
MIEYYYIYAVINKLDVNSFDIGGVKEAQLLVYKYKDYSLIYSLIDTRKLETEYKYLMQHEEVLEMLMEKSDVIPFSFSTILLSEASLEKFCNKYNDKILSNFENISGTVEMGVKILISKNISDECKENDIEESNGYSYMIKKFKEFTNKKNKIEEIKQKIYPIENSIYKLVIKDKKKYNENGKIIFNGAYLIEKENMDLFRECINNLEHGEDFEVMVSGPWPPYSFVSLDERREY